MNQKLTISMTATVLSLMFLTSCGSSGSTSSGIVSDNTPRLFSAEQLELLSGGIAAAETASAGALQTALGAVAGATPARGTGAIFTATPGIVLNGPTGIPTEGNDVYQATVASRVSVGVTPSGDGLSYTWDLDRASGGDARARASGTRNSSGVFSSVAFGNSAVTQDAGAGSGRTSDEYYVGIFTDHDGSANDADYLAAGFWLHVAPAEGSNPVAVSFGAFADSDLPFDFSSAVTGEATYTGKAAGVCVCPGESDPTVNLGVFEADAALTVNFGTPMIRGSITGFVVDGEGLTGDRMRTVTLESDAISTGFFSGDTSLDGGTTGHGEWGGEFYGVRDADNLLPSSVGGTFGASAGGETFVGAFGAHRQ